MTPPRASGASPHVILAALPHQDPFRFITQLRAVEPDVSAEGLWRLTGQEAFFAGHFPADPIVPGVLIGEALAQLSGLIGTRGSSSGDPAPVRLARIDLKFPHAARPPTEIELRSRLVRSLGALRFFDVSARVDATLVAEGTVTLHG